MGDALLLEIFLAFSQPCHMVYLLVGKYIFSFISWHSFFLNYFDISINIYFTVNDIVLLKKFAGEGGERVDVQKLFGYIGLFTLVALWWLGKCCLSINAFIYQLPKFTKRVLYAHNGFHVPSHLGSFAPLYIGMQKASMLFYIACL